MVRVVLGLALHGTGRHAIGATHSFVHGQALRPALTLPAPPHPALLAAGAGEDTRLPDGCMDLVSIMLVRCTQSGWSDHRSSLRLAVAALARKLLRQHVLRPTIPAWLPHPRPAYVSIPMHYL